MTYVDNPGHKAKHQHYENKIDELDKKNNDFSCKKFYHQRNNYSTHKKTLKAFGRISMCLNEKQPSDLPVNDMDNVCFILINDYENKHKYELGVGPLNDGYIFANHMNKMGYKVFYLYNTESDKFSDFLAFFMKNTSSYLTVFYTGRVMNKSRGISFAKTALSQESMENIITQNYNGQSHVVFVTDSLESGSAFNIDKLPYKTMISIAVKKKIDPKSIVVSYDKHYHGIFTYYLVKEITRNPAATPREIVENMSSKLSRFDERVVIDTSDPSLNDFPVFKH